MTSPGRRPEGKAGAAVCVGERALDANATLPIDPQLRVLELSNGLRCWVRPHDVPPRTVALTLVVGCGSLVEEEDERGFAHLVEHMAFRGTERFPPGATTRFFESLGTRLGRQHNATTTLERTSFSLTLPTADEGSVSMALACLADFAFRMTILPEELDAERRVILEEMRGAVSARSRVRERTLELLVPGARVSRRHPLGSEEVIRAVTAEKLRAFYSRWYRPENAFVLIAGDIDPESAGALIEHQFGEWKRNGVPGGGIDPGVQQATSTRTAVLTDAEASEASVSVLTLQRVPRLLTVADLRSKLVNGMGLWLINQRLVTLIQRGRTACREAQATVQPLASPWSVVRLAANGPTGRAAEMVTTLVEEIERVCHHGFLAGEIETGRHAMGKDARQALLGDTGRSSESIVRELEQAAASGQPPMSRAQVFELVSSLLPTLAEEEVARAFRANLDLDACLVLAVVPAAVAEPERAWLGQEVRSARNALPRPPATRPRHRRLLRHPPPAGTIVAEREDGELGVRSLRLGNGVRVHLRSMTTRPNRVCVCLTLLGGRIRETSETAGLTAAAALLFAQPASETLSSVAIREYLTQRALAFGCTVDDDATSLRVIGDPADIEDAFALFHLLLTRPHLELAALRRWQSQSEEFWIARRHSLDLQLAQESLRLLSGDDPRFRPLPPARAMAITRAEAQRWLEEEICRAPLEVAVVGDLPQERSLELVLRYLGSLPERSNGRDLDSLRGLVCRPGPLHTEVEVPARVDRAAGLCGWRAASWGERRHRHLLKMAEQVILQRLQQELRERRGLTYSAEASFSPSKAYPDGSLFAVALYAAPERATGAMAIAQELVGELAEEGPSEGEMESCRRQMLESIRVSQHEPRHWCRALSDLDLRGGSLRDLAELESAFASYTREDMVEVMRAYITEARRLLVICTPSGE